MLHPKDHAFPQKAFLVALCNQVPPIKLRKIISQRHLSAVMLNRTKTLKFNAE